MPMTINDKIVTIAVQTADESALPLDAVEDTLSNCIEIVGRHGWIGRMKRFVRRRLPHRSHRATSRSVERSKTSSLGARCMTS